jgi:hypothetical protein
MYNPTEILLLKSLNVASIEKGHLEILPETNSPSPAINVSFDIIGKNGSGEVIFVGWNTSDFNSSMIHKKYPLNEIYSQYTKIIFCLEKSQKFYIIDPKGDGRFLEVNHYETPLDIESFIETITSIESTLKTSGRIEIDNLNSQLMQFEREIQQYKDEIEKLKKSIISVEEKYQERISSKEKKLDELDLFKRSEMAELIKKENDIIIEILKKSTLLEIPQKKENTTTVRTGNGPCDRYERIISIENIRFSIGISKWKGDWYLKLDLYNYYERGPLDIPHEEISNILYYMYDKNQGELRETNINEAGSLMTWKNVNELY